MKTGILIVTISSLCGCSSEPSTGKVGTHRTVSDMGDMGRAPDVETVTPEPIEEWEPPMAPVCETDQDCIDLNQGNQLFNDVNALRCLEWTFVFDESGQLVDNGEVQYVYCGECQSDEECPEGMACSGKRVCGSN